MKQRCEIKERTNVKGASCTAYKLQPNGHPEILHCTRPAGHEGEHHAHNQYGKCYGVWQGSDR